MDCRVTGKDLDVTTTVKDELGTRSPKRRQYKKDSVELPGSESSSQPSAIIRIFSFLFSIKYVARVEHTSLSNSRLLKFLPVM
jgi:hypothetical protein